MSTAKILQKIYYDAGHHAGYGSVENLFRAAKLKKKKITRQEVERFLEKQDTFTLHRPVKKKFKRRKTLARYLDHIWQADLVDLQAISKENRGHSYILTVIDVLSRYAFAVPLKNKTGLSIIQAFKKIFSLSKRKPKKIHTDYGTEFYNKSFKDFLRDNKIILYSTSSDTKASIVERFNRTLKSKMYKYFATVTKELTFAFQV